MELGKLSLFSIVKKRMAWLGQRQEILAQNIANSDTPGFKSRDLKPFKFEDLVRREGNNMRMMATKGNHLSGISKRASEFGSEINRHPQETDTTGSSVVIEEQMAKMSESSIGYRMTTDLYKKHLNMIKMAIGRR